MRKYALGLFATEFTLGAPASCGQRHTRSVCSQGIIALGLCFLLALGAVGDCRQRSSLPVIEATEAKEHVGEEATVCGRVVSTRYAATSRGSPTFLNFERPYPGMLSSTSDVAPSAG
ncbi:MAG: hypothetical protein QXT77_06130 [Candidatus Methanomethylicaceae archaeon]